MTPPKALERAVKAHNSAMRVVWAKAMNRWAIEIRMPARHPDLLRRNRPPAFRDSTPAKIAHDRYTAMQEGYYPLFHLPLDRGHDVTAALAMIHENDAAAQGSFAKINAAFDAAEALLEKEQEKARKEYVQTRASDAADALQWAGGHRIATSDMAANAPESSDHIEEREGYTLRVRKRAFAGAV